MSNEHDSPKLKKLQETRVPANTAGLKSIEGSKTHKNTVIDVITGKIHDLPEHYLKPVDESE